MVSGKQFKILPVQFLADAQKQQHPTHIENRTCQENQENDGVIDQKNDGKDDKRKCGKDQRQRIVHNETADALVVLCALQDVAQQLVLKERDGQFHQLDQVVGNQGDVHPCRDVQQNPVAQHIENHHAQQNGNVANQHHIDEFHIRGLDAHVDDSFRDKRQHSLQGRHHEHNDENQAEIALVGEKVFENTGKAVLSLFPLRLAVAKLCGGFHGEQHALILPFLIPSAPKLLVAVLDAPLCRVGNPNVLLVGMIHHDEMAVFPKHDGREGYAVHHIVDGTLDGQCAQSDALRTRAQVEQRNALFGDAAAVAHILQRIVFAEMLGNDFQRGRPAILRIHLILYGKTT